MGWGAERERDIAKHSALINKFAKSVAMEAVMMSTEQKARVAQIGDRLAAVDSSRARARLREATQVGAETGSGERAALRLLWQREGWSLDGMGFEAWECLADLALADRTAVDVPGCIHARRHDRVIQIAPRPLRS